MRAEQTMYFATRDTTRGWILLAHQGAGICHAAFGSSATVLIKQLTDAYADRRVHAETSRRHALSESLTALERYLERRGPCPRRTVDLQGTPFQLSVWRYLLKTRSGQTLSYGELAKAISAPTAVRAVASACGANPIALFVPCHRVLRTDGGLGGYRWGLALKKYLLKREQEDL